MIASLRGELAHIGPNGAVIDVGGVGYQVHLSQRQLGELPGIGETVRLFTHLVHREDAMLLFGFPSLEERELFLLLTGVSGIGAKTAMGILSALTVPEVVAAVVGDNPRRLAQAPGIGKKTGERIVLELREKLAEWQQAHPRSEAIAGARPVVRSTGGDLREVETALAALGYSDQEIDSALTRVAPGADVEETLRQALAFLSGF